MMKSNQYKMEWLKAYVRDKLNLDNVDMIMHYCDKYQKFEGWRKNLRLLQGYSTKSCGRQCVARR